VTEIENEYVKWSDSRSVCLASFIGKGAELSVYLQIWNLLTVERLSAIHGKVCTMELQFVKWLRVLCERLLEGFSVLQHVPFPEGNSNVSSVSSHVRKSTKLDTTYPILHTTFTDRNGLIRHRSFKA
jgi:hypothetical protein